MNKRTPGPTVHPLIIASRLLPAGSSLDNAQAVKALLTGVLREVLEGNLSTKQAATVGYLGQTILQSIQSIERAAAAAAANAPAHPILYENPEAAIDQLTSSLQSALGKQPPPPPEVFRWGRDRDTAPAAESTAAPAVAQLSPEVENENENGNDDVPC